MKRILIIFIVTLGVVFTSCQEDLLDKQPLDKFSELEVWNDASLAEGFVFDIYASVVKDLWSNQFTDDYTDNIVCNDDNGSRWVQAGAFSNTWDFGWNQYWRIRKCNLVIENLNEESEVDPGNKTKLVAEAKMLRAMINYWMVRRFGGIMIVDKVLTPEDELKLPRSTEADALTFILKDLDDAVEGLPETAEQGRLTKAAAHAFITTVALHSGDYDKVIAAADAVEEYGYSLESEYKNLFNSFEGTTSSNEVILAYVVGKDHNRFIDTRMFRNLPNVKNGDKLRPDAVPQFATGEAFEAWPLRWPSQELVDAYLVEENGEAVHKTWEDFQGMPSRLMWENRDDRFEQSIVRDSAQYSKSIFTFRRGGNSHWTSNPLSTWGMSKSGYMFRKWMYEHEYFFWNYPVDWAEPILRLGEVNLNKAEAYGRKGDIPKAVEYMNMTRTVHGGLPALSSGVSADDFWKYYKIERRVEMAQEDDRYWSLVRWAKAENATSIPELDGYKLHCMDMEFDGIVNVTESPFTVVMKFEMPKRLLFPIPDNEVREHGSLNQNPGWE